MSVPYTREGKRDPSPHSSQVRAGPSSAPGWLPLPLAALSPPRSQHPHHDAGITPGRRPPPSARPPAAAACFASPPPPQLSGGRGGQSARGRRRARGEPRGAPGRGRGRGRAAGAAGWGPVQTDGSDGAGGGGGGWGWLSPRFHTPRAAGRSSLPGRLSSGSSPLSSPWGCPAEALKTGGKGPSSARQAPRLPCDLAERRAGTKLRITTYIWIEVHEKKICSSGILNAKLKPVTASRIWRKQMKDVKQLFKDY
ncbi:translation initiation factor IF-2-like [Nycticebus coucang]|uniref:translation initiation factor IF-2-like n=1 Tax=Nycticebus coucang TaxID=9470 RepID=UPI00234DBCBC|nr:translation initiation factor IF-2-like [Nycticebus coucang]